MSEIGLSFEELEKVLKEAYEEAKKSKDSPEIVAHNFVLKIERRVNRNEPINPDTGRPRLRRRFLVGRGNESMTYFE